MSEESRLYLEAAHNDLKAASSNLEMGYFRIAISRAYYAMFYAASALLATKGETRSKHGAVIAAFGLHFVKTGLIEPEYGRLLSQSFEQRQDSDYDLTYFADEASAGDAIQNAQRFVDRMERYLHENEQ
jgi:uncharacterized protein (UPF0332 family)